MSDTIKPTPPAYSHGPTFQRAGIRRSIGPSSPSSTPSTTTRNSTTTTSINPKPATSTVPSHKPSLPTLSLPKASPSSLSSSLKEPVPPSAPASYRPPRTSILTERSVRTVGSNGITSAHRKSMPPLYTSSLESLSGSQTARPAMTSSNGEQEMVEQIYDTGQEQYDTMHEEIWIQTENNSNNNISITNDLSTFNAADINPSTPPDLPSLNTGEGDIENELSGAIESTNITAEIPTTTVRLQDIIVEKPNEVITLSETVTLVSSNNQPDKPQESNTTTTTATHIYPIPHIIPQKQDEKHLEFSKMPNYAVPLRESIPKPSFSVLRTKSGEIIPRYTTSKAPEKPNYVIHKSTPAKTFPLLRTNSSEKIVPKPIEKHATSPLVRTNSSEKIVLKPSEKHVTSPLSANQVLTKSNSFQLTNSSENLSKTTNTSRDTPPKSTPLHRTKSTENIVKPDDTTTPTTSRTSPQKSTPLHRTKSNENIPKMDAADKTNKIENTDKTEKSDKSIPKKPLHPKSIATILRTISSDSLKNENPYKRKLGDNPKDDGKPNKEEEKPKSGESVPTKSPTYIYPKPPVHAKSPAKSPSKSPAESPAKSPAKSPIYSYPPKSPTTSSKSPTTSSKSPTASSKSPTSSSKSPTASW
jgi:hypothetical protein